MIKLSNSQAAALLSDQARRLMNKQFPVADSFQLLDIVQSIEKRIDTYHKKFRDIVEKHNGTIKENGAIVYPNNGHREKATAEIKELNAIVLEYPGEKLSIKDDWPSLTVAEAALLKPLITEEKKDAGHPA